MTVGFIGRAAALTFTLALGACAAVQPSANSEPGVKVRVLALNDFHGYLEPNPLVVPDPQNPGQTQRIQAGGIAYIASLMDQLKAEQPNSVVVGVGDLIGASPLVSSLLHDEPTLLAMNALGMRVSTIGNHEFDQSRAEFMRQQKGGCGTDGCLFEATFAGMAFPYISANILSERDGSSAWAPHKIETIDGVRVAFIGATLRETPSITLKERVAGLVFEDEALAINRSVATLKAQGVRAIVVLLHQGADVIGEVDPATCSGLSGPALEISNALDAEVDVVMTAHTHKRYACEFNGKLLTQGESYGRFVTQVDLTIDRASGQVSAKSAKNHLVDPNVLPAKPELAELVARARAKTDQVAQKPVAKLATPQVLRELERGGESPLGRLIADAQLAATQPAHAGGAQIALMNHGGVRQDLPAVPKPDNLVTFGDCYTVHPFNNQLIVMDLSGLELKAVLEQQWVRPQLDRSLSQSVGFEYAWDARRPAGDFIVPGTLKLNGQLIAPQSTYRIVTNAFLADGGGDFSVFPKGRNRQAQLLDVEALMAYLREKAPVAAPLQSRATRID